jgi:hypothetical protein
VPIHQEFYCLSSSLIVSRLLFQVLLLHVMKSTNLSLCCIKHHAMKMEGADLGLDLLSTSAIGGYKCSALRPSRFNSGERDPDTHYIQSWVGTTKGL